MRFVWMSICVLSIAVLPVYAAGGSGERTEMTDLYNAGVDAYEQEDYTRAAESFLQSTAGRDGDLAVKSYYNLGNALTRQAEAEELKGEEKIRLLEQALDAFRRSRELGAGDNAVYNAEVVLNKLRELRQTQQEQQTRQDGQNTEDSEGERQTQQEGDSPQDLLSRQRELSDRTETESRPEDLADDQRNLADDARTSAGEAEDEDTKQALNQAADAQEKASENLARGNKEEASRNQAEAERHLEQALAGAQPEEPAGDEDQPMDDGEIADMLDLERKPDEDALRTSGGILDVEKDW